MNKYSINYMGIMRINELKQSSVKIDDLNRFADWVCDQLKIETMPNIKYGTDLDEVKKKRTFGTTHGNGNIWVYINNRNTADTMRTLCHELIHHKQFEIGTAHDDMSDDENQYVEDEANAIAGRMMREYGAQHSNIYESVKISRLIDDSVKEIKYR